MNQLKFFIFGILIIFGTFHSNAQACTVAPLNIEKETQELPEFARRASSMWKKMTISSITTEDASAKHVWLESDMCPDALAAGATVTLEYIDTSMRCASIVEVSKLVRYYQHVMPNDAEREIEYKYTVKVTETICEPVSEKIDDK